MLISHKRARNERETSNWTSFTFGYVSAIWNNGDPDSAALYNAQGQEVSRKSCWKPSRILKSTTENATTVWREVQV